MISRPDGNRGANRLLMWMGACLLVTLVANGCHGRKVGVAKPKPSSAPSASTDSMKRDSQDLPDEEKTGLASWYGRPYHGRRTSSGEIYDMNGMTAAHRTLPYGTMVRVENLDNGKQVQVRINDRGPFAKGRIIDLSYAAAEAIDMVQSGTARVRLQVIHDTSGPGPLTIQAGSFRTYDNAVRLREKLEKLFSPVFITEFKHPDGLFFRVLVGEFNDYVSASEALQELKKERQDAFIIRRD